jgi:hypothetical protein
MSNHPFKHMFEKALKDSSEDENLVLEEAERLLKKGYSAEEIHGVLNHLHNSLIQDRDVEILAEATDEFSRHLKD